MYSSSKRKVDEQDLEKSKDDEKERLINVGDDEEEEEDDFFLKGAAAKKSVRFSTDKMKVVQAQVSEVTSAMRDNVGRLLERGDQLEELSARSDHLATTADSFRNSSVRLRRNMWWQTTKSRLVIGCTLIILALIVFVPIIIKYHRA
ncbi:vesicle-associated membrane protein 4-like [Hyalella azteca]|uniref:Vesicle-associated membrane protein 4-like n=1 Tax=Hyalella azteca TaxID=294128 RepID=A0A8B7P4X1_HYAAZ|nr:vesicle-associated membrane protein 4-like [Hyalella azteca]